MTPLCTTTKPAVKPEGVANAASTQWEQWHDGTRRRAGSGMVPGLRALSLLSPRDDAGNTPSLDGSGDIHGAIFSMTFTIYYCKQLQL